MAAYGACDLTLESRFHAAGESKSTDTIPLCQGDSWVSGSVGNSTGQGTRWRTAPVMPRAETTVLAEVKAAILLRSPVWLRSSGGESQEARRAPGE